MARRKWNIDTINQVVKGENPFIQVGYTPIQEKKKKRKNGDTWIDSKGVKWKKQKGYESVQTPLLDAINDISKCSVCGMNVRSFGNRLDKAVFVKTSKCYDCLEKEEMLIRINGKWESYEKMKMLKNRRGALKDFKDKVLEAIHFLKNESGKIRDSLPDGTEIIFTGKSNPQWLIDAESDLIKVTDEMKNVDKEILDYETELSQINK